MQTKQSTLDDVTKLIANRQCRTTGERLACAVLLFYNAHSWGIEERKLWKACTGEDTATTKVLGSLARQTLNEGKTK